MTKHDVESKRPLHSKRGEHFLNQLGIMSQSNSDLGNNLGADASAAAISGKDESTPVYITLNVRSIRAIDPNEESYQLRCHLYLMWGVDFQRDPEYTPLKKSLHDKALDAEYYSMTTEDVEEMEKHVILPSFRFANAKETSPTDDAPSMRVYATKEKESEDSTSFILWNQGFELTLSTHFPLHDFPFDAQDLFISIRQDDGRSWDKYNLTMAIVQFHKEALEMAEWELFEPQVSRGSPGHKEAQVFLRVQRQPGFFVVNVCLVVGALCATGLIVFSLGTDDLNDRINVILTLLLTAVAFKFVIADAIPKVGYSTLIDEFVLYNMAFLFGQLFLCIYAHHLEHGGHEDDEDDDESPSHLMATHLPILFSLLQEEQDLRKHLADLKNELDELDTEFPHGMTKQELKLARKLRHDINRTKEDIHENFTMAHWTVNQAAFGCSCAVFLAINLWWSYNVMLCGSTDSSTPLNAEAGRNWYALSYANPSFLPQPGDERVCKGLYCPAGW